MSNGAYLDYNAAAPLAPAAMAAMTAAMRASGNPSSVHRHGRAARRLVEDARSAVAAATGAEPADLVFTGSGTEACRLMLRFPGRPRVVAAATEHAAVLANGDATEIAPVDGDGLIDLPALDRILGDRGEDAVVAVMLANNETGVIQPIPEIAACVHAKGGLLAVDAAQAFGKVPVDLTKLGADALALSSAKIGGPIGVGAAAFRRGLTPLPLLTGGGQERGLRGGSENVVGVAGFGAAAGEVDRLLAGQTEIRRLRDRLEAAIARIAPGTRSAGSGAPRLANTAAVPMPGTPAATQVMSFDLAGYAVSAGAACSSGKVARSHVLAAMGLPDAIVDGTVRVSLGPGVTDADVDGFADAWSALYSKRRRTEAAEAAAT